MPAATNKPQPYGQSPQPELKGSLQPYADSIGKNFSLIEASVRQIIAYLYSIDASIASITVIVNDIIARLKVLEREMAYLLDLTDGIVNAAWFDIESDGEGPFTAATILAAAASITGLPKTLMLKRGTWIIDADVDLSAMASSLLLAPGAVLLQSSGALFKFPLNVTIPDQGFHFSGDTGFAIPLVGSKVILDPRWWGALETSDSTAALIAFEEATYAQGTAIVLPAGTYGFTDTWSVRMGMTGYNVTIQQLNTTRKLHTAESTVYAYGIENFFIRGKINVHSADACVGAFVYGCDGAELAGATFQHNVHMGVYLGNSDNCWIHECNFLHTDFITNPSTGKSADGIYQISCIDNKYENCYAYDVKRICFVSEGIYPAGPSYRPSYFRCTGEYAHSMDESTTEVNAAFWAEDGNGATYMECNAINIGNGVGQTLRSCVGFNVGGGQTEYCEYNYLHCRVFGNTATLPNTTLAAFSAHGFNDFVKVNVTECYADNAYHGVEVAGGIREVAVTRFTSENWAVAHINAASVITIGSNTALTSLTIDGLSEVNCVRNADGGAINILSAAVNCDFTLKNSFGIRACCGGTSGYLKSVRVIGCDMSFGLVTRVSFSAPVIELSKSKFTVVSGSLGRLCSYTGTQAGAYWANEDVTLQFAAATDGFSIAGATANFSMRGGSVQDGFIRVDNSTSCDAVFDGVIFNNFPTARGAIQANNTCHIKVIGCTSYNSTGAVVPYQIFVTSPITSILVGNRYQATAALTTWTTPALAANQTY